MGVFLGEQGLVQLMRTGHASNYLSAQLDPGDVNVSRRRFSFDHPEGSLISGDQLVIGTTDGSPLELVAGHAHKDGRWYVHVDDAGGIRLYSEFVDAINGGITSALELVDPSRVQQIFVMLDSDRYRCLGQIRQWQMTTSRDAVDITALGENFRRNYTNGLISGQGTLACMWDYKKQMCDAYQAGIEEKLLEEPNYLAQLVLRVKEGASFLGRFYIHYAPTARSVWYEAECLVTNVALSFAPGERVDSQVEFVTTGKVALHIGQPPGYILQQGGDRIEAEQGTGYLELEDSD